jgi:hypothetical protein
MARGELVAIGSIQHLKTKFLDGYTVDVVCQAGVPDDVIDTVVSDIVQSVLPGSMLSERFGQFLKFEVSKASTLGLGTMFRRLQELKHDSLGDRRIDNYSISQW